MFVQDIILNLHKYWKSNGCTILQPYDSHIGAATFHWASGLKSLGPNKWRCAYLQPTRRPSDGRYGQNPNRLQHYFQYQVILKPSPRESQQLYLNSLSAVNINPKENDIRFVEDDWKSPTMGAWGLGWEIWCNGMEISQFTYFQQMGGINCKPVSTEITYGIERLAMYVQKVNNVYNLQYSENLTYGEIFQNFEVQFSKYNFDFNDHTEIIKEYNNTRDTCESLLEANLFLPAYDFALKLSHLFNVLDARGRISVLQRQNMINQIRDIVTKCAKAYLINL